MEETLAPHTRNHLTPHSAKGAWRLTGYVDLSQIRSKSYYPFLSAIHPCQSAVKRVSIGGGVFKLLTKLRVNELSGSQAIRLAARKAYTVTGAEQEGLW